MARQMKVLLRADAGRIQGTGHIMRCLTLAEALRARGHIVELMTTAIDVHWLAEVVDASGLVVHACAPDSLDRDALGLIKADWVVVDSYRIESAQISALTEHQHVLAIVDGDTRATDATLYLDQNIGAETTMRSNQVTSRMLAGADFALVRDRVLAARRREPWILREGMPKLLCFFGGSDPTEASTWVARALTNVAVDVTIVAPEGQHSAIRQGLLRHRVHSVIAPTPQLPELLAEADAVVTAAGTSAWDVCTLGIPSLLMAVVDNQSASLRIAQERDLCLGLDVTEAWPDPARFGEGVTALLTDQGLREELSRNSLAAFDGLGKVRVAIRMEEELAMSRTREG